MPNPFTTQTDNFNEKSVPVMLYTQSSMILGEVRVVSQIRVCTWLKTSSAPDVVRLFNAKVILTTGTSPAKPIQFPELHIPNKEILAMHLLPQTSEPLDYDSTEPNRHLMPVSILFSAFRVDGSLWVSTRVDLAKFIELNREDFTSVYDVHITSPIFTSLPAIRAPMMICREAKMVFASQVPSVFGA
jgi:hypothetical protein